MSKVLIFLLGVLAVALASSQCGFDTTDLSSLTKPHGVSDYSIRDGSAPYYYWYLNPCAVTNFTCGSVPAFAPTVFAIPDKKICQYTGDLSTAQWGRIVDGVYVVYTNGDTCFDLTPRVRANSTVYFHCNLNAMNATLSATSRPTSCSSVYHVQTKEACVNPSWFDAKEIVKGGFAGMHVDVRQFDQKIPNPEKMLVWTWMSSLFYEFKTMNESAPSPSLFGNVTKWVIKYAEPSINGAAALGDIQTASQLRRISQVPDSAIAQVAQCLLQSQDTAQMYIQDIQQIKLMWKEVEAGHTINRYQLGKKWGELFPLYYDCV